MLAPPAARCVLLMLVATFLLAEAAAAAPGALRRGDAAYARRGEGQVDGQAAAEPIAEAVAAYEEARRDGQGDLETYWKLLRALFFQGHYAMREASAKHAVFCRGVEVARMAEARLAASIGADDLIEDADPAQVAAALRGNSDAAPVCFWSALAFASWGRAAGVAAALREGLAEGLRRRAELVIALDPAYEGGGAHRLLGRIHAEVPRIPFLTPWVERERAVRELREAFAIGPDQPWNQLLLGMTLLELVPAEKPQALELLHRVAAEPPRPEFLVEDAGLGRAARDLLAGVGGR